MNKYYPPIDIIEKAENIWIGSPFKKLATFVDAHEEGEEE